MRSEPLGQARLCDPGGARLGAALQINQHGAIPLAFPQGEVIHTEYPGRGERRAGCLRSKRSRVLRLTARSFHAWPRRPRPPAQRDAESEEALGHARGSACAAPRGRRWSAGVP